MVRRMKKILVVLALVAVVWGLFRLSNNDSDLVETSSVDAVNRIWVERIPADNRDKFHAFVLVEDRDVTGGAFVLSSAFEGDFSVFEWTRSDARFDIKMMQTGRTHALTTRVTDQGCAPFDHCLEVQGAPRGSARYGSMREWIIEPGSAAHLREHVMDAIAPITSAR